MARLKDVRYMGNVWADSVNRGVRGLGYGSETSISRLTTSPGRVSRRDYSPDYEPDPIAKRFESAYQRINAGQRNILYCWFVLRMTDTRLMKYDRDYRTREQARWAIHKAMQAIARVL
jgi:hypothetical protein